MPEGSPDAPQGDQASTESAPPAPPPVLETPPADKGTDAEETARLKMELEKWKAMARSHEDQSSKTVKELEKLRRQSMTDQERAVAEAQDSGYRRAVTELGGKLVDAEIRTVAVGIFDADQLRVLLQGLDRSVFLLEDGSVDEKSVRTWVTGIAPKIAPPPDESPKSPQFPDLGQGVRGLSPALNGNEFEQTLRRAVGLPPS